jgi:1,4-alpha-glucan branching enzyme
MSHPRLLNLFFLLLAALTFVTSASAQSSRSGWGNTPYHGMSGTGVTFRVWAPNATSVFVPGQFNNWSTSATPLAKEMTNNLWTGVWSADVTGVLPGQQYKYFINYTGGSLWKHDPRARLVTASGSATGANDIVYDPQAFEWKNDYLPPPAFNDLFIYELHIGTFFTNAPASKFIAATNRIAYLKSLGVNAVELLPIAEFPGNDSWGYNPAQLFAVENAGYGGADGLKTFVQACHRQGLAVFLDVVHNHYGPEDLDLWDFDGYAGAGPIGGGIYFNQANTNLQITPYGDTRPNCSNGQVAAFIRDNFTLWLDEYHVDGFRWDTPGLLMNANSYGYIPAAGTLVTNINSMIHRQYPGKISIAEDIYNSFGFDSAWDTTYPYTVTPVLTTTDDSSRDMTVIANAIQNNVRYGGTAGNGRVAFLESHDVVGDLNGGTRLPTAIDPATPNSYYARKRSTLGAAITLTAPGIPMIFQGEEMLENQPFDSSRPVDWSKTNTYSSIVRFYHDLIRARRNLSGYTPGLKGDQCRILQTDNTSKLVAFTRWQSSATNQNAVVIAHFANTMLNNYAVNFPFAGTWYVHLNSDSTNYSADYGNIGSTVVTAAGTPAQANITIAPYSALILSPTPDAAPQVTITATNGIVHLAWPATYAGWQLAQNIIITGNAAWTPVPPDRYQTNPLTISLDTTASNTNAIYRLQKM